ncbi:MAG: dynamin family protein [Spirochaetales bacterium]|nr:dynamin family protein [Spirochaetales bacterium]
MLGLTTMKRYKEKEAECDKLKKENDWLKTSPDVAAAESEKVKQIEEESREKLQAKDSEISSLTDRIKNNETKLSRLESERSDLQNRVNLLQASVDGTATEQYEKELQNKDKEIKRIKEEIEDLEDDLDSEKKKLNKKNEELKEVQQKKEELEEKHKQMSDQLEDTSSKLTQSEKTVARKQKSLEFVQEILKAQFVPEAAASYELIEEIANYIADEIAPPIEELNDSEEFWEKLIKWVEVSKKPWIKNKKTVALIGEFSAGKTSIVNAILSQGNNVIKLPVSSKATTAIPTYISYKQGFSRYRFYSPANVLYGLTEDTFKQIDKDLLDDVDGISKLIKYFVMTNDNPNLRNLSILDTPGFASQDQEDTDRTVEVINECDALFWVFDVNNGTVNNSSLKTIKEKLRKPLYIIINKVDTKSETEVDRVENLIKNTFLEQHIDLAGVLRFGDCGDNGNKSRMLEHLDKLMNVLYNLKDTSDTNNFLQSVYDIQKERLDECKSEQKTANSEFDRIEAEIDEAIDVYDRLFETIYNYCVDTHNTILNGDEAWFSDKKKITGEDAEKIIDNMSTILDSKDGEKGYLSGLTDTFIHIRDLNFEKDACETNIEELKYTHKRREKKCKKLQEFISKYQEMTHE